jgi:hypothetical protein
MTFGLNRSSPADRDDGVTAGGVGRRRMAPRLPGFSILGDEDQRRVADHQSSRLVDGAGPRDQAIPRSP